MVNVLIFKIVFKVAREIYTFLKEFFFKNFDTFVVSVCFDYVNVCEFIFGFMEVERYLIGWKMLIVMSDIFLLNVLSANMCIHA